MSTEPLLRVSSVQVEGLFDQFDHRVDLEPNERVTILHGPNGVGKTMLLRMVSDLLRGRYNLFLKVPFRRFALALTDGSESDGGSKTELTISPHPSQGNSESSKVLELSLLEDGKQKETHEVSNSKDFLSLLGEIARSVVQAARAGENKGLGERDDSLITTEEVDDLYADEIHPERLRDHRIYSESEWLKALRGSVAVHLIEAQRLLRLNADHPSGDQIRPDNLYMVSEYANDLSVRINDTMAHYGQQSQRLDQSFPQRLLTSPPPTLSTDDLKARMEELDIKQAELKEIGLLDKPEDYPFDTAALDTLNPASQRVMSLYVQDTSDKLEVLTDLARRTRLLLDNVNHKFLHKRIRIDREAGLVAERDDGIPLELEALSSGEQHELVLHYDLLFRVRPNTLVLIDEPELSLHVAWQKRFLPDLLEIVAAARFDVLIATHSPYIVGDRSDLMIGLGEDPV